APGRSRHVVVRREPDRPPRAVPLLVLGARRPNDGAPCLAGARRPCRRRAARLAAGGRPLSRRVAVAFAGGPRVPLGTRRPRTPLLARHPDRNEARAGLAARAAPERLRSCGAQRARDSASRNTTASS